jgi:hypothetical protein
LAALRARRDVFEHGRIVGSLQLTALVVGEQFSAIMARHR